MSDLISRQDAIDWCNEKWINRPLDSDRWLIRDFKQMLDALPSADRPTVSEKHQLSEETPTDTSTDLISRQDAREAIEKLMEIHFDRQVVLAKARDAIVSLPSAEPKTGAKIVPKEESDMYITGYRDGHDDATKTARWIQKDLCADRFCSNCDYVVWDSEAEEYNFCPNCGARMIGE